jgi:hypothetical protein
LALVGCGRRDAPGVVGFDHIRQLKQFFLGGFRRRERSLFLEFHLGCMIAMPMASVGRFSPLGPIGIIFFLFLCRPILSF